MTVLATLGWTIFWHEIVADARVNTVSGRAIISCDCGKQRRLVHLAVLKEDARKNVAGVRTAMNLIQGVLGRSVWS
jgi:hypothetical protein